MLDSLKKLLEETGAVLVQSNGPGEFLFVLLVWPWCRRSRKSSSSGARPRETSRRRRVGKGPGDHRDHIRTVSFQSVHTCPLVALGVYFGFIVYSPAISRVDVGPLLNNFIACSATYLRLDDNFVALAPGARPTLRLAASNFAIFAVVFVAATLYFIKSTGHDESGESY